MKLHELKELIEDYQGQFDEINDTIADHQKEIGKVRSRKVRKLNKMQELEGEIQDMDNEVKVLHALIEERDFHRKQLNEELIQQLLLLIG